MQVSPQKRACSRLPMKRCPPSESSPDRKIHLAISHIFDPKFPTGPSRCSSRFQLAFGMRCQMELVPKSVLAAGRDQQQRVFNTQRQPNGALKGARARDGVIIGALPGCERFAEAPHGALHCPMSGRQHVALWSVLPERERSRERCPPSLAALHVECSGSGSAPSSLEQAPSPAARAPPIGELRTLQALRQFQILTQVSVFLTPVSEPYASFGIPWSSKESLPEYRNDLTRLRIHSRDAFIGS
jgi:hypothetical protein